MPRMQLRLSIEMAKDHLPRHIGTAWAQCEDSLRPARWAEKNHSESLVEK
jgi:hypothetical protein